MINKYILDGDGQPVVCDDLLAWACWFEDTPERIVAQDRLPNGVCVSTVFLGIDHNFGHDCPPVLWETMIFGGPSDQYQNRYTSREDAVAGHAIDLRRCS